MEENSSSVVIKVSDLKASYGNNTVFEGVNFSVKKSDLFAIQGANGSGKTTLIRSMLGLVEYEGIVEFKGILATDRKIGYLPQINSFDREFPITIHELILSGLQRNKHFFSQYMGKDNKLVEEQLSLFGLEETRSKRISEVSGGELQRALLGRALISRPNLLFLDEPTNNVDATYKSKYKDLLTKLVGGITIVIITHDIEQFQDIVTGSHTLP